MLLDFCIVLLIVWILYCKWRYQYWKRKRLPYLEPRIPYGTASCPILRKEQVGVRIRHQYDKIKSKGWKHAGLYFMTRPAYLVVDLDYVKNILTKDFQHFVDRGVYYNERDDPLSANLFAVGGTKWRNLRTKLTPAFTSGKMRMMFQTLVDCSPNLLDKIEREYERNMPIDIKDIFGCFTTDIIGSCAFGLECETFINENSPFRVYGKKAFASTPLRMVKSFLAMHFPSLARTLRVRQIATDVSRFFMNTVQENVKYRETNNFSRKDFMQLLIDMKNNKLTHDNGQKCIGNSLTIEEIAAQSFIFFLAGFETSSTAASFALYELAKNPDLQQKLRDEIVTVLARHGGKVTYEAIQEMKYMDQVINETLRKYPPLSSITRKCVKDYKVPDADVLIEKGIMVVISILGIHYDKNYYPEPEKFDPDRFSEENKASRHHYAHIPFGEGPRICIGMRFGLMQTKVGLTALLNNYKFTVNQKTKEPLKMKVKSLILAAEGEIWLNAHKM